MFHIKTVPEFDVSNKVETTNPKNIPNEIKKDAEIAVKKKVKKNKVLWNEKFLLKKVSLPEKIPESAKIKKKYKIQLTYNENGKNHNKTIRFGDIRVPDYIEDKDETKRNKIMSKLGNTHNVLHPNFWRLHLLNQNGDIKSNWTNLISNIK